MINYTSICSRKWSQPFTDRMASGRLWIRQRYIARNLNMRRRVLSFTSLAKHITSYLHSFSRAFCFLCSWFLYSCSHLKVVKRCHSRSMFYCHSQSSSWFSAAVCHRRPILSQLSVSALDSTYNFHISDLKVNYPNLLMTLYRYFLPYYNTV